MTITSFAQWLFFVYLNLCAASVAFVLAWPDETRRNRSVEFAAAWVTLFLSIIIIVETALGLFGLLTRVALAATFGLGAAIAWLGFLRAGHTLALPPAWRQAFGQLAHRPANGWAALPFALAAWLALTLTLTALLEPTALFDSFVYHLPMPVDWLQHGWFAPSYIPFAEVANSYFPGNAELLYFWTLAPFGNDLFVRLTPVAMWLLLGFGLWRLCRLAGASRAASAIATLIFVFTPVTLSQSTELWTDGALTALFVLSVGHLFAYARRPSLSNAALFGLAAGLMTGVKYSGPAILALLLLGFAAIFFRLLRAKQAPRPWAYALVALLGLVATGSFWYLRNFVLTGNFFYPVGINLGGRPLLPGPGSSYGDTLWDFAPQLPIRLLFNGWLRGYGIIFYLAVGMAVALAVRHFWISRRSSSHPRERLPKTPSALIGGFLVATLLLYLNTPYSLMRFTSETPITAFEVTAGMRFSMIAASCAIVLVAVAFNALPRRANPGWFLALFAIALGLAAGYDVNDFHFFPSRIFTWERLMMAAVAVSAAAFALRGLATRRRPQPLPDARRAWAVAAAAGIGAVLLAGVMIGPFERYREGFRYPLYQSRIGAIAESWQWVDQNINDARVAYVGDPRILAAYGADFRNEVRYININGGLDERYDDYFAQGTDYRGNASFETWARNLANWSAQYLVFTADRPLVEEEWAKARPDIFGPVFVSPFLHVYRIDNVVLARNSSAQ